MLRKTIMVAIAVGVVAAMALPAAASANWKHHVTDIQRARTIGLTGNIRKQGGLGGIECQVTMRVRLDPGTTGAVETLVPHPKDETTNCKGLGGLGPCQVHDMTPTGLPWTIHTAAGSTIAVTWGEVHLQLTGGIFCLVKQVTTTPATLTLTPNQPNTFSSFTLSGISQIHIQTNSGASDTENVNASGTLNVEPPDANTYSM